MRPGFDPPPWRIPAATFVAGALALSAAASTRIDEGTRPAEEFRFVPVRVHLLKSEVASAVNTKLTAADVTRIFGKADTVWSPAGVRFWVESVTPEKPANVEVRRADVAIGVDDLKALRPDASRAEGMFHVYYVGSMSVNGVYMARDAIFVQEAAELRPVVGGIDEPLPRVTSHELGHAMGLPHRQDRTNLMASGTTGTRLNDTEISKVRLTIHSFEWIRAAAEFEKDGEQDVANGRRDAGLSKLRAVANLPGESALKNRAKEALRALEK